MEACISHFLHYSSCIVHFDMSGLGMPATAYKYIAAHGIRKSRTLLAIHMSGMVLTDADHLELRRILKVERSISHK